MIQIDDAGSGSLIGGTGIGIYDFETKKYHFEIIPLKYYQTDLFQKKAYQDYVIEIVKRAFTKFNVTKKDLIQICPGYMFDKLKNFLTSKGYMWENNKIEGVLQEKVENSFEQYVISLGLPKNFVKHARYAFGFHRLLKWVFADFENRKKLCKTEWKSFKKWSPINKSIYENKLMYQDYCLKCGQKLNLNSEVITIEYKTLKPATINLHKTCFSGNLNEIPPIFIHNFKTQISIPHKINLDSNVKLNEKLILKSIDDGVYVTSHKGTLIGHINKDLESKLLFWLNKGFSWNCQIQNSHSHKCSLVAELTK